MDTFHTNSATAPVARSRIERVGDGVIAGYIHALARPQPAPDRAAARRHRSPRLDQRADLHAGAARRRHDSLPARAHRRERDTRVAGQRTGEPDTSSGRRDGAWARTPAMMASRPRAR
jgi:hypothetical protein